ncbi:MAG: dephospho-CoA kinase [bacterium]|nr:dephospho-CoA kinase [bacterium]
MSETRMIIGITGGIGSGKSTVGNMLKELGAYVLDSDMIAHELTSKGSPILIKIRDALGDVLTQDGELDRRKVASIVFARDEKLKKLERILHPEIQKEYSRRAQESGEKVVFILIPLLFEEEVENKVDEIWLCYSPEDVRLERVMKRDGCKREDVKARMAHQIPDDLKLDKVDLVIDTSLSLDEVRGQVIRAFEILKSGIGG